MIVWKNWDHVHVAPFDFTLNIYYNKKYSKASLV